MTTTTNRLIAMTLLDTHAAERNDARVESEARFAMSEAALEIAHLDEVLAIELGKQRDTVEMACTIAGKLPVDGLAANAASATSMVGGKLGENLEVEIETAETRARSMRATEARMDEATARAHRDARRSEQLLDRLAQLAER